MESATNRIIRVGWLEKGTGAHISNIVYSKQGLCPTICASYGYKQPPAMILINEKGLVNCGENKQLHT